MGHCLSFRQIRNPCQGLSHLNCFDVECDACYISGEKVSAGHCLDPQTGVDGAVAEIEKKIIEAFEVFDQGGDKTVSIRDIGSIVRSLGCFPTEAELHELLANPVSRNSDIKHHKTLQSSHSLHDTQSYRPIPEDVLLHAFEALDENKCGYITKEELVKYMTGEGEPFTEEEMEDMLSTALDPETNTLHYRDYILKLIVE
ncbi:Efcab2 [Columba livia]|nr:Efcab2 [Columba livia]